MRDVASLSVRLGGKQLTIRLMPIPGKKAGEMTEYNSPYMANGRVMHIGESTVEILSITSLSSNSDHNDEIYISPLRTLS